MENYEALSSCGRPADRVTTPARSGNLSFHPAPTFGSYGRRSAVGHGPALLSTEANDGFGSRLWENAFADDGGWAPNRVRRGPSSNPGTQARIACNNGAIPKIAIIRFTL